MSESLFSRVFSYRQRDSHSPLENYLTEIFAYCLENDEVFRKDFFALLPEIEYTSQEIEISTQKEYDGYGRPDIELVFSNSILFIECKVESVERTNQLSSYCSILIDKKENYSNRHIIFLTKYFEHREQIERKIKMHLLRWCQVFEIIENYHSAITKQLKKFLKEQNMDSVKNFTLQDLLALKTIPNTISKMDELLEQFKPIFEKYFGGYSKDSSRSSQLRNSLYTNYVTLTYKEASYWLHVGFSWDWDEEIEIPFVGLFFDFPKKKFENSDIFSILDKGLVQENEWEFDSYETSVYYSAVLPLTDFILEPVDNISAIKKFITDKLNEIVEIKMRYPELFTK